jgi:hypothetical protein
VPRRRWVDYQSFSSMMNIRLVDLLEGYLKDSQNSGFVSLVGVNRMISPKSTEANSSRSGVSGDS